MKYFKVKPKETVAKLTDFISKTVRSKGFRKVVIGISGGLDSAVVAYLSCLSLGNKNVIGVILPYGKRPQNDIKDARHIAGLLKIKTEYIDISPIVDIYFKKQRGADRIRRGNKMARERMSVLYDLSKKYNGLVIGTSNKIELLLGYGTIHGDVACALNPIGGLYKSQVRAIAGYLGIPARIINKPPTAGLWRRQTDEDELGYRYEDIDRLLFFMVDRGLNDRQLIKKGFSRRFTADIGKRIKDNSFKSQLPVVARIS